MYLLLNLLALQWEGKVERYQEEFDSISRIIKKELEQFEVSRVKEFKKIIIKYLESQLRHQEEVSTIVSHNSDSDPCGNCLPVSLVGFLPPGTM